MGTTSSWGAFKGVVGFRFERLMMVEMLGLVVKSMASDPPAPPKAPPALASKEDLKSVALDMLARYAKLTPP